jgi:hypothetical protein
MRSRDRNTEREEIIPLITIIESKLDRYHFRSHCVNNKWLSTQHSIIVINNCYGKEDRETRRRGRLRETPQQQVLSEGSSYRTTQV